MRWPGMQPPAAPIGITLLAIDDRSAVALGGLPLDRATRAEVVDRLLEQGAAWMGFGFLFPDPSRHDPAGDERFAQSIQRAGTWCGRSPCPPSGRRLPRTRAWP